MPYDNDEKKIKDSQENQEHSAEQALEDALEEMLLASGALEQETPPQDEAKQDDPAEDDDLPDVLPVLSVRDVVVFNYMILPLFIGREKSVKAVEAALAGKRHLLVCTQKDERQDEPKPEDLFSVGTVVNIMRMLKMPDGRGLPLAPAP